MCGSRLSALSSQVGDDVPHAVVGEEEEFAARLREVVDAVARVQHLKRSSQFSITMVADRKMKVFSGRFQVQGGVRVVR